MNTKQLLTLLALVLVTTFSFGQTEKRQVVIVTGVRFAYPLVQKWIDDYNKTNPDVQIVIEARGSADPKQYDILVEAYEQNEDIRKTRDYAYVARYAVLPVSNSKSAFAKEYVNRGLTSSLIKQLFFDDLFADADKAEKIPVPFTAYTRLQKAGAPSVFANTYGLEQRDIKGKAIAGSDEHLLKAILRDSTAISYLPLALIYNGANKQVIDGLTVLPIDLNDNGKVADDEKIVASLDKVLEKIETGSAKELKGLAIGYVHLSLSKDAPNQEAADFIRYVIENGATSLHEFGYALPEESKVDKTKFKALATTRRQ